MSRRVTAISWVATSAANRPRSSAGTASPTTTSTSKLPRAATSARRPASEEGDGAWVVLEAAAEANTDKRTRSRASIFPALNVTDPTINQSVEEKKTYYYLLDLTNRTYKREAGRGIWWRKKFLKGLLFFIAVYCNRISNFFSISSRSSSLWDSSYLNRHRDPPTTFT